MSMGGGSAPQPQDPNVTAGTQLGYNVGAQAGSQTGQITPWGSSYYQQTGTGPGGIPLYTAYQQLDPSLQGIMNQLRGGASQELGYVPAGNPSDVVGGPTSWLMNQQLGYLNPFFTQQTNQLDAQLRNQGLGPGERGYDIAMNNLKQSQGQTVAGATQQALQQAIQLYQLPIQTAGQLLAMATPGAVSGGQYIQTPQLQAPDYISAVNAAQQMQMQAYQAQVEQQSALMQGLFGIAGKGLGMLGGLSDSRVKENISPVDTLPNGIELYKFNYKWDRTPYVGVMAEQVQQVMPEAVSANAGGYLMVNYAKLGVPLQTYDEWIRT